MPDALFTIQNFFFLIIRLSIDILITTKIILSIQICHHDINSILDNVVTSNFEIEKSMNVIDCKKNHAAKKISNRFVIMN